MRQKGFFISFSLINAVHSGHIKAWTKRDPVLSQVLRYTLEGWPKAVNSEELTPYYTKRTELSVEDGCILWGTRVIVPPQGRSKVLSELHEAHPGESHMKALARSYVWWPGLDQDIVKKVKSCDECQAHQLKHPFTPGKGQAFHGLGFTSIMLVPTKERCS